MKGGLEKRRQDWQRQLIADTTLVLSDLKVAIAITWYINRTTGVAFPAMATLAKETGYCERTIIRSVKRLEARGHLYVKRDGMRGDKRGVNRYVPVLKPAQSSQRSQPIVAPCHLPHDTRCHPPRDTYVSQQPLNLTTELTTYVSPPDGGGVIDASHFGREEKGDFRDSKEVQTPSPEVPLSVLQRQCYDLARAHAAEHDRDPVRNQKLVTKALNGGSIEDVLAELEDAFDSGMDLGEVLSRFWMDEWRSWS